VQFTLQLCDILDAEVKNGRCQSRVSATIAGGLAFGLIEVLGQSAPGLGSGYANAIAFVVLVIVLVVRPRGLLGRLA